MDSPPDKSSGQGSCLAKSEFRDFELLTIIVLFLHLFHDCLMNQSSGPVSP